MRFPFRYCGIAGGPHTIANHPASAAYVTTQHRYDYEPPSCEQNKNHWLSPKPPNQNHYLFEDILGHGFVFIPLVAKRHDVTLHPFAHRRTNATVTVFEVRRIPILIPVRSWPTTHNAANKYVSRLIPHRGSAS